MALLKKRLGEMGQGRLTGPDPERVTLADLGRMLLGDYALKGNRSTEEAERSIARLKDRFGEMTRALDIAADMLVGYAKARQQEGAAPATARNELAHLRRSFCIAVRAGRLPQRPAFPIISVNNRRTGFFEEIEFRAVLACLPEEVAAIVEFLFWSGWRKGEALGLEWRHVDFEAGVLRIKQASPGRFRSRPCPRSRRSSSANAR